MSRPNVLPTHQEVVRVTRQLRRGLRDLLTRFPEDEVEPGDRVFPRLLTHSWRHLRGVTYGPLDKKYIASASWMDEYHSYLETLREYCSYVLLKPEAFASLPLNGSRNPSATDCLRLLDLQIQVLANIARPAVTGNGSDKDPDQQELTAQLRTLVSRYGLKQVADDSKCNPDTIGDLLAGKTRPRRITLGKLRAYIRKQSQLFEAHIGDLRQRRT